jgi:hypothetical protein
VSKNGKKCQLLIRALCCFRSTGREATQNFTRIHHQKSLKSKQENELVSELETFPPFEGLVRRKCVGGLSGLQTVVTMRLRGNSTSAQGRPLDVRSHLRSRHLKNCGNFSRFGIVGCSNWNESTWEQSRGPKFYLNAKHQPKMVIYSIILLFAGIILGFDDRGGSS